MPGLDREFKASLACIAKMYLKIKKREEGGGRGEEEEERRAKLKDPSASSVQGPSPSHTKVHCTHLLPGTHSCCIQRLHSSGGLRTKTGTRRAHCFLLSHQARVVFPTPRFVADTGSVEECTSAPLFVWRPVCSLHRTMTSCKAVLSSLTEGY